MIGLAGIMVQQLPKLVAKQDTAYRCWGQATESRLSSLRRLTPARSLYETQN
jgi:hypothetical protein